MTNHLFQSNFKPQILNKLAADIYQKELRKSKSLLDKSFKPGIMSTVHIAGNSLNYNPHVHMIATRDLVNIDSGEIKEVEYLSYKSCRFAWQNRVLNYLQRKKIITKEEKNFYLQKYKNGSHVYFQPIYQSSTQEDNDILFRTAEYLGTNILHNSQVEEINETKKTVTIKFKNWVERSSKEKSYKNIELDIFEFMARMLLVRNPVQVSDQALCFRLPSSQNALFLT